MRYKMIIRIISKIMFGHITEINNQRFRRRNLESRMSLIEIVHSSKDIALLAK